MRLKYFSRCVKFLSEYQSGCYKQKAINIRAPPSLPRHVMLYKAREVEETLREEEEEGEDYSEEADIFENGEEEDDKAMTSHGDFE